MPKGNKGIPKKDITGLKFGNRTVLSFIGDQKWLCKCDCGHIGEVEGFKLKKGESTMCSQCLLNKKRMNRDAFMIGKKFGHLIVKSRVQSPNKHDRWLCVCKCGAERHIYGYSLLQGDSKGCPACSNVKEGTAFRRLYRTYKDHAIKRGYEWGLSLDDFKKLTQSNCFYTGLPPSSIAKAKGASMPYVYNGVDRLDNTKGYTIENSVPCRGRVNEMKMEASYDEFIDMCYLIIKEHERKKNVEMENKLKAV